MPYLIPTDNAALSTLSVLFTFLYWGIIGFITVDLIKMTIKRHPKKSHRLTFEDYQKVIDGKYNHAFIPFWTDKMIGELISLANTYRRSLEKVIKKNLEYAAELEPMNKTDPEYSNLITTEYMTLEAMVSLAADVCDHFACIIEDGIAERNECHMAIIQKYCIMVNRYKELGARMTEEEFIPADLKERYLSIFESFFALFELINSNIYIS